MRIYTFLIIGLALGHLLALGATRKSGFTLVVALAGLAATLVLALGYRS